MDQEKRKEVDLLMAGRFSAGQRGLIPSLMAYLVSPAML